MQFPGDRNEKLLATLEAALPTLVSLEMETHTLLELADASSPEQPIAACGAAMVVWNRHTKQSIGAWRGGGAASGAGGGARRSDARARTHAHTHIFVTTSS